VYATQAASGNEASGLPVNDIVALASVVIAISTNIVLYIHLSSTMTGRFDSFERRFDSLERRFDVMLGKVIEIDNRLTRVEERMGIRP
jgi:hypothetical protein